MDIIPSILVKTKQEFLTQLESLEHAVTHLQLDVVDGTFAPNKTWSDPSVIALIKRYTFELHLMDHLPLETVALWKDISPVTRFIIHAESVKDLSQTIAHASTTGREIFVALNPETPLETLSSIHPLIQGVLFMGVNPGFQGQKLIPHVLEKITLCRTKYPDLYTELDGGVHEDTLKAIVHSGVHAICPGSLVFGRKQSAKNQILSIKNKISEIKQQ